MIPRSAVTKGFNMGKPNEFLALASVSLALPRDGVTVLKGPSGSGKTTLLSLIGCMARPTAGRIWLDDLPPHFLSFSNNGKLEVTSMPERFLALIRRRVFGFTFQHFNLIKGISVLENVMLPAYPSGTKHSDLESLALELLELFGIAGRAEARVEWLSGGEAQRTAIARALINDPLAVIADEPTAHLDTKLSLEFMDIVARLKERRKTVIIASHDPLVFESDIVDRVVTLRDGRVDGERA